MKRDLLTIAHVKALTLGPLVSIESIVQGDELKGSLFFCQDGFKKTRHEGRPFPFFGREHIPLK